MHPRAKHHSLIIGLNFLSHYYFRLTFNYFLKYLVFVKPLLKKNIYFVFISIL
jgi:hypothetical protein